MWAHTHAGPHEVTSNHCGNMWKCVLSCASINTCLWGHKYLWHHVDLICFTVPQTILSSSVWHNFFAALSPRKAFQNAWRARKDIVKFPAPASPSWSFVSISPHQVCVSEDKSQVTPQGFLSSTMIKNTKKKMSWKQLVKMNQEKFMFQKVLNDTLNGKLEAESPVVVMSSQ